MTVTFADEIDKNCPHDDEDRKDMGNGWRVSCLYCGKHLRIESKTRSMPC